jgi:alanyl-tRNA synthetase
MKIPGLRAVFGERYPDPVRVVSLQYSLEEIEKNIEDPKWASTSTEFCGGTHVAKTDEIKEFVILEESSIAKGIRRVVAVTGHEAAEVSRKAAEFETKLERIANLDGKDKEAALKPFLPELAQSGISLLTKQKLTERHGKITSDLAAQAKAKLAADQKVITDEIKAYFASNPNANVFVGKFDVAAGNPKILSAATTAGKSLQKAIYVFSTDAANGKVAHTNFLPKAVLESKKLGCKQWLADVSAILGGKGGGKDESATGVGSNVARVDEAIKTAQKVYADKVEA